MMFLLDLAFSVELLALGLGVVMLVWANRNEGVGVLTAKIFGYIIIISAVSTMICTTYFGLIYWYKGTFHL